MNSLEYRVVNSHKHSVNGSVQKTIFGIQMLVSMMNLKPEDLIRTSDMVINIDILETVDYYMIPFIDMLRNV